MKQPEDRLLTAKEAAAFLRVSVMTIHRLRVDGRLRAIEISEKIKRFPLSELRRFADVTGRALPHG